MTEQPRETAAARQRICFVVSSAMTAEAFLGDIVRALAERYEIDLAVNAEVSTLRHPGLASATLVRVDIPRPIAPLRDLRAVVSLVRLFRRGRYSAVHSLTPKAGLLTAVAAFVARVPVRVHTFTGQVWATQRGLTRRFLKTLDAAIARLDTHVLADSFSQLDFLRQTRVLKPVQGEVIAKGSVCGVDPQRFRPDAAARAAVRKALDVPATAVVFLFVGRLKRDKGVLELAQAFERLALDSSFLLFVGPDEENLEVPLRRFCPHTGARLRFVGWTAQPERYMAAADVFCLPSRREGFGTVVIEAAAAGLPAVASRIYGIVDAIEDGRTGVLFEPGNVPEIAAALQAMAEDAPARDALGAAARARACADFSKDAVTRAYTAFYERVLGPAGHAAQAERLRSRFD